MPIALIHSKIPRPLSNFLQMLMIFAVPSGSHLYPWAHDRFRATRLGRLERDGRAFLAGVFVAYAAESRGNPLLKGVDQRASV